MPSPPSPPDEDVDRADFLARLRANDPAAFESLVRRFGGPMLAVARRYLRDDQEAADAVQDAFLSAFRSLERFEGSSKLGTWLHRIVINASLMKLRSRSRRQEIVIDDLLPTFDASGHHAGPVRRWAEPPDERLLREETRGTIRACIDRLPDDYRTILLLRDIDELSTEEAAEILGVTPGAVKTRLHRARQALRTLLEPYFAA